MDDRNRSGMDRKKSICLQIASGLELIRKYIFDERTANFLSVTMCLGVGSATVPVAAAGVPPAAFPGDVFGQRPKTAGETSALPKKSLLIGGGHGVRA
jgi:hypothetical protein